MDNRQIRHNVNNFNPHGQGIRYWFADHHPESRDQEEEYTYNELAYIIRHSEYFGFVDGDTIAEASSHSDAELWSDVIAPAIERGDIEVTEWGTTLDFGQPDI